MRDTWGAGGAVPAARKAGVSRVIHSTHGHVFTGYFGFWGSNLAIRAERLAARWCDRIIVLSHQEIQDHLSRRIGREDQFRAIPNGIKMDPHMEAGTHRNAIRAALGLGEEVVAVAVVGRLVPVKGHGVFLKSFQQVRRDYPNVRAFMVGGGELEGSLKRSTRELGLEDGVKWLGYRDDVPRVLAGMDMLAHPSIHEGFGLTLIEAQAAALPVVATRVGGVPEAVIEGTTALLVSAGDSDKMAQALLELVRDPVRRKRMGESGRRWVRDRFTVEAMVNQTLALYDEI